MVQAVGKTAGDKPFVRVSELNNGGVDRTCQNHFVEFVSTHLCHFTVFMSRSQIAAKQLKLLVADP